MSENTTENWASRVGREGRPVRIIAGVFLIAVAFVVTFLVFKKPPQKALAEVQPPETPVLQPDPPEISLEIRARGIVVPKVRIQIMPEVAGKVVYVHSQLHAGGLIRANEKIAQIDPSSYELAVRQARAVVDEAQARLDVEMAAKGMAQEQKQPFNPEGQVSLPAVLQEPLVRQAAAALESAQAGLASAELQLSRTSVVLPYDVLISGETASLGQYAGAGQSLGIACGTEAFEVEVPIRSEDLARLGVLGAVGPAGEAMEQGARPAVEVRGVFAGREYTWPGEVVRTTGRVNPESGMVSVIVEIPQPLEASADRPALLPGMAVEVVIGPGGGVSLQTERVGDSN